MSRNDGTDAKKRHFEKNAFKVFVIHMAALRFGVHISKNTRDIGNSFGTVIPYEYTYKKMQKKSII